MTELHDLRVGLLADGTSDRALLRVLVWLLRRHRPYLRLPQAAFATRGRNLDLRAEALQRFRKEFGIDLLFVHRDAEGATLSARKAEIPLEGHPRYVAVVPIRMTEAWLLIDERAIRVAAGNPNGRVPLGLPDLSSLERVANPKDILRDLLVSASELTGPRRRAQFKRDLAVRVHRVADEIEDFSPLFELSAFRELDEDLTQALDALEAET